MLKYVVALLTLLVASPALATTAFTYDFTVSDFVDSNNTPPPTVTSFQGSVTLMLDLSNPVGETGFVTALTPLTTDFGFQFDTSNTIFGKTTQVGGSNPIFRIYFGGIGLSTVPSIAEAGGLIGATDDFRIGFEIDQTGAVTSTLQGQNLGATYNTSSPASAYVARSAVVSLAAAAPTPIPLPATLPLLLVGLGGLSLAARRARRARAAA